MRSIYLAAGAAGIIGLFAACGGNDTPPTVPDGSSGSAGKSSKGGKSGNNDEAGGEAGEASGGTFQQGGKPGSGAAPGNGGEGGSEPVTPNDPLAPNIVITSPKPVDDPNDDGVLAVTSITVSCVVTESSARGASMVNESSVRISVLDSAGKVIDESAGVPTSTPHEFSTSLSLTNVPAGVLSFVCRAEDILQHAGSAKVTSLIDKGPTIVITKPALKSAHALSQPLDVEFSVAAAPLNDADTHADVQSVTLDVAGVDIALKDAVDSSGHYRLQVNLKDPRFNPTPNGTIPISVKATNERAPTPVVSTLTRPTDIDGAGPVINISSPADKDTVGGTVRLKFSVTDAISGIDPGSIVVSLNEVDHAYDAASDRWSKAGDSYTFEFDSRQIKNSKVQITVNIAATDLVGNITPVSSEILYLDNYPPSIDLDPFNVRTLRRSPKVCSGSFDPVGARAKNDLGVAAIAGVFRAVIWDQTNTSAEIPDGHPSQTDPSTARLYLEGDPSKPLLIDKDHDGTCDEVSKVDSTNSIELDQVPHAGSQMWFRSDAAAAPAVDGSTCAVSDGSEPQHLCTTNASEMWEVIYDEVNNTDVIYGVGVSAGLECTGVAWEFAGKLTSNGWVCFAARAVDHAGNVGVSRPLRICVDNPEFGPSPSCATASETPPSCADGCTVPPRWGNRLIEVP